MSASRNDALAASTGGGAGFIASADSCVRSKFAVVDAADMSNCWCSRCVVLSFFFSCATQAVTKFTIEEVVSFSCLDNHRRRAKIGLMVHWQYWGEWVAMSRTKHPLGSTLSLFLNGAKQRSTQNSKFSIRCMRTSCRRRCS